MVVMANYLNLNMNIVAGQRNQQHQRDAGAGHQLHQERERVAAGGAQRDQDRGAQEAPDADPRTGRNSSAQISHTVPDMEPSLTLFGMESTIFPITTYTTLWPTLC